MMFFLFKTEPTGMLDVWYMKQHIDYKRQQISLFWKVSFQCPLKIRENYVFRFLFFFRFRAASTAYGGSQARGLTGTVATGLYHSHSSAGSEPHL